MKTALIFKSSLLRPSETFIADQALALRSFHPVFIGLKRPARSLDFKGDRLYLANGTGIASKLRAELYIRTGFGPVFHSCLRSLHANLVHAHFAPDGVHACTLAKKLRIPLIVTLHGYDVTTRQDFSKLYFRLWKQAKQFICVSEFIRHKAIEAGFPEEKLCVHHTGIRVPTSVPDFSSRTPDLILFVGRLVEKKGVETLIRAMQKVQASHPAASLVLIGDGPLRRELEELATALDVSCQFVGLQPPEVVRDYMLKAGLLCAPSQTASNGDSEGLPTVILEAQAVGLPVVSTFHSGIPDAVIVHETGLLVEERDWQAVAESIIFYLDHPGAAALHGQRGRQRVIDRFDITKQTRVLEAIYERALLG